jgi:hypothetical protein
MSLGMRSPVSSACSADFLAGRTAAVMYMVSVLANSAYFNELGNSVVKH